MRRWRPGCPTSPEAQLRGLIGAEHVQVIERFVEQLPDALDYATREAAEEQLAELAVGFGPAELRQGANRIAYLLNQDGSLSDAQRARRRCVSIDKQGGDGMSRLTGWLDPEARATLDAVLAKWAAPGMGNPDDEAPCVDGDPDAVTIGRDLRITGPAQPRCTQRHGPLASWPPESWADTTELPATIIVSTTLQELQSAAGQAVTAAGHCLPMRDLIRLASHAHHYLVIYDKHTKEAALSGSRPKRLASPGQRIVLHARDRGCTRPAVPRRAIGVRPTTTTAGPPTGPPTSTNSPWPAAPDNRLVEEGGWTTRKRNDGRTEWIPPPHLDTGQARVNNYHHPERYLIPDDEGNDEGFGDGDGSSAA